MSERTLKIMGILLGVLGGYLGLAVLVLWCRRKGIELEW